MSKEPPPTCVYINIGCVSSRDSPTFTSADNIPHSASSLPSSRDSAGINLAFNVTLQSMSSVSLYSSSSAYPWSTSDDDSRHSTSSSLSSGSPRSIPDNDNNSLETSFRLSSLGSPKSIPPADDELHSPSPQKHEGLSPFPVDRRITRAMWRQYKSSSNN